MAVRSTNLRIGFAKRDISPPVLPEGDMSIPILGFRWERAKAYREVHDPLHARAMAAISGEQKAILFACDLFGDAIGFTGRCAAQVLARYGVPSSNVLFGCTHTHTSPETLNICGTEVAAWWIEELTERLIQLAGEALSAAKPATLHWAELPCEGLVVNRRARYVDAFEQKHGPADSVVRERTAAVDQTLRSLCALDGAGRPFGAVVNFACHPVIMQTMPMVSADYCGPAAAGVEEALGQGFISLYLNGPCGDINPKCSDSRDYRDCETMGRAIAAKAAEAVRAAAQTDPLHATPVCGGLSTVKVERQDIPNADDLRRQAETLTQQCREAEQAGRKPLGGSHPLAQLTLVREQLAVLEKPKVCSAEVHALRLGEIRLVSFPGELLTALGQDARRQIGGKTMLSHCARGHLGYICPCEAFVVGGYETGPGTWSWLKDGAGEHIVAEAVELAQSL